MLIAPLLRADQGAISGGALPSPDPIHPSTRRRREHSFNFLRRKEFGETARVTWHTPMVSITPPVPYNASIVTQRRVHPWNRSNYPRLPIE